MPQLGPDTTFFSYARSDSDFVLKLAKDLRQAGADVWLDQLDIKSGSRWDLTIENALKDSTKMLVILSPDSVLSNNVMDEVSFALEEGKTVIPVLFKSCDIPFRLRRLQFADFTKDYNEALESLLTALNLGKKPSGLHDKKVSRPTPDEKHKPEYAENYQFAEEYKEERSRNAPAIIKNKLKTPILIAGISTVMVMIIWVVISAGNDNANSSNTEIFTDIQNDSSPEILAWNDALVINSIDAFKSYQLNYPDGLYLKNAQYKIDSIETAEAAKPVINKEAPGTKKEVKQSQSRVEIQKPSAVEIQKPAEVEIQKPVELTGKKIDLTGRWLTDENLEWKIIQTGDKVEITFHDKLGNPITVVEGRINGNTFSYRKERTGNDLEGKFTISEDGNSLNGSMNKFAGMKNNLTITRIL
jgi:hypothetical protein